MVDSLLVTPEADERLKTGALMPEAQLSLRLLQSLRHFIEC